MDAPGNGLLIMEIYQKAAKCLNMLKAIQFKVERRALLFLYKSLIRAAFNGILRYYLG